MRYKRYKDLYTHTLNRPIKDKPKNQQFTKSVLKKMLPTC